MAGYPPFGDDSFEDIKKGEFVFDDDPWDNISKNAKDLITKLLTVNPSKRFTVAQIFAHPWMKVKDKENRSLLEREFLEHKEKKMWIRM